MHILPAGAPADPSRRRFVHLAAAGALSTVAPAGEGLSATVPLAPMLLPTEGRLALIYEIQLANGSQAPATLASLRITADGERELARYGEKELAGRGAPSVLAPGQRAAVYIELEVGEAEAPRRLAHDIAFTADNAARRLFVTTAVDAAGSPLAPPLAGGPWVAIHWAAWPRGHRRMVYAVDGTPRIPGRYAIDFVRIDARGRSKLEGSERPQDFLGYGAPVLAVADGVIASTRDDMQEAATVSASGRHPQLDATGNYVSLRLADGRVVFYEHLKPGSVTVKPGQRVKVGQVIGALGFTGDSTGPHLHFSVASHDSPLGAEGVGFTFERFELLGRYPDLGALDKTPWQALEPGVAAQRRNEWPGWNTVLRFPAARSRRPASDRRASRGSRSSGLISASWSRKSGDRTPGAGRR
jgi:hypothetical protein